MLSAGALGPSAQPQLTKATDIAIQTGDRMLASTCREKEIRTCRNGDGNGAIVSRNEAGDAREAGMKK
jgi:hypothetical protein